MDTLAAVALASEPPIKGAIKGRPYDEHNKILAPVVWRQVIGISLWNFIVMLFVIFFGRLAGGLGEYTAQTPTVSSKPDNFDAANPDADGLAYLAS